MKFFDPKQDVLDIQLTQHGKYLLSSGKFKPMYYAFFDDDILYDSQYASSTTEEQNNIETRIQSETPRLKIQYVHHGIETNIQKINEQFSTNMAKRGQKILPTQERSYTLNAPIGTSSPSTKYLPAWDVRFIEGEISGSVTYEEDSFSMLRVPQVNVDIAYEILAKSSNLYDDSQAHPHGLGGYQFDTDHEFSDNITLSVKDAQIILDITEENALFDKNNFELEVFLVEEQRESNDNGGTKEILKPLSFEKRKTPGVLDDEYTITDAVDDDPSYVSYYLEITVDDDMSVEDISRPTGRPKRASNIYETPQQSISEEEC